MQDETGTLAAVSRWYLAYTDPRREAFARDHLIRQGYETYLPLYAAVEPMFPRYLFFRPARPSQSIAPVRSTRGVQSVVRFGSLYAWVPAALIAAIQEQEASTERRAVANRRPRAGQRVRVHPDTPALAGLEGLVHSSASRRVIVLLEILGRQTLVRVPAEKLEVI